MVEITTKKRSARDGLSLGGTAGDSTNEIEVITYINLDKKMVDAELISPEEIRSGYIDGILGTIYEYRRITG